MLVGGVKTLREVSAYKVEICRITQLWGRGAQFWHRVSITKNGYSSMCTLAFAEDGLPERIFPSKAISLMARWRDVFCLMEDFFELSDREFTEVLNALRFVRYVIR